LPDEHLGLRLGTLVGQPILIVDAVFIGAGDANPFLPLNESVFVLVLFDVRSGFPADLAHYPYLVVAYLGAFREMSLFDFLALYIFFGDDSRIYQRLL